jgi:hypothetical protein
LSQIELGYTMIRYIEQRVRLVEIATLFGQVGSFVLLLVVNKARELGRVRQRTCLRLTPTLEGLGVTQETLDSRLDHSNCSPQERKVYCSQH